MKKRLFLLLLSAVCLPVAAQTAADDSLRLDSIVRTLPEVMVSGERPVVKVRGGALVYDVNRLPGNATTDNAYDALMALPGVVETDGKLTLGGRGVTIIMDGQVTNLSQEQLAQVLKSVPKGMMDDVEVMYNAPAKYQVKGACIKTRDLRAADAHGRGVRLV